MQGNKYIEITTARLLLRTLTESDAAIVRRIGEGEFETDEAALEWIRWVNSKTEPGKPRVMFYIWLTQTGQCIGRVYFHSKPELDGEVEIGYGITEEYRNQGYVTEAATAAVQFAFEQAGQMVLSAIIMSENISSRRVIEKLGFSYEGVRMVWDNGEKCEFDYFKLYNS